MKTRCLLQYQPLTNKDLPLLAPYVAAKKSRLADHTLLYWHMWGEYLGMEYAIDDGLLFLRRNSRWGMSYYLPCSATEVLSTVDAARRLCEAVGNGELRICALEKEEAEALEGEFSVQEQGTSRTWADYLYLAEDLATLSGRRYHKKRNLVHQFEKLYPDCRYEPLDESNHGAAMEFLRRRLESGEIDEGEAVECRRALAALADFARLPLSGGALVIGSEMVALTVGERVGDVLFVHIEKGDRAFKGAYQYINYCYARDMYERGEIRYINREDDAGDEGLRKAKLSYFPVELLHKYHVVLKQGC